MATTKESTFEREVPGAGKTCKTWYGIYGTLGSGKTPLIILHGGPGVPHQYLTSLAELASDGPVIFYDQLGCGKSTHLPEKKGDDAFWTTELFLVELRGLLKHLGVEGKYDLYGHSWGGMLAACHAITQPKGLRRLILADALADSKTCGASVHALLRTLPEDVQATIHQSESSDLFESPKYKEAMSTYYKQFCCRLQPWPEALEASFAAFDQDSSVYLTMWGPSEFQITGNLREWNIVKELHKITAPTLLLNGRYDVVQDICVAPFFHAIPKVKWYTFAESAHMPHLEEKDRLLKLVGEFLN